MNKKLVFKVCLMAVCCVGVFFFAEVAMAAETSAAGDATSTELDPVYEKAAAIMEGAGGKLAAIGLIIAAVWNREKIGIPATAGGVVVGIVIPSFPSIINAFSATI